MQLICLLGRLLSVIDLTMTTSNNTVLLTWEPPFTLDIDNIDQDITYCVEVLDLSPHTEVIYSECGINVTEFSYPIPPDAGCRIDVFSVIPVNIVGLGEAATTSLYYPDKGIIIIIRG